MNAGQYLTVTKHTGIARNIWYIYNISVISFVNNILIKCGEMCSFWDEIMCTPAVNGAMFKLSFILHLFD